MIGLRLWLSHLVKELEEITASSKQAVHGSSISKLCMVAVNELCMVAVSKPCMAAVSRVCMAAV